MQSSRHSGIRVAGAVLLAVLVLVPLGESGHSHASRDLTGPCATCVVAHHSPASVAPTIALCAITAAAAATVFAPSFSAAPGERSPRFGRAPPAPSFIVSV
jgi:hypothetical protein